MAAAGMELAQNQPVPVVTVALFGVSLACFMVLLGLWVTQSNMQASAPRCYNCGTRLYLTIRSADRRELLTCFACGLERVLPARATPERRT